MMSVLIAPLLLIAIIAGLMLIVKTLKKLADTKTAIAWMLFLPAIAVAGTAIYKVFFVKMEFIPSKVYPNLYLIKNPVTDRNSLNNVIKEKTVQYLNKRNFNKNTVPFSVDFYEYSRGESGTAYFIENKERLDGMTAELLEYYPEYILAEFRLQSCGNGNTNYIGRLDYYKNTKIVQSDTLFNSCDKNT